MRLIEALRLLKENKHQKAVWEEVLNFLMGFVDDDVNEVSKGIDSEAGLVPQEVILSIARDIEKTRIEPLTERVLELEKSEVTDGDKDKGKQEVKERKTRRIAIRPKSKPN